MVSETDILDGLAASLRGDGEHRIERVRAD